ncbi:MAG: C45 family peptidase [Acidimicrobiia bacterium]|nr:C45 family peptidase [Acidimicrobiia bacterium]
MKRPPIRVVDLTGAPSAMGRRHGLAHAEEIRAYTADRVALVAGGRWTDGPMPTADVLDIAESMLGAHEEFHPGLHAEMMAMADAAGITPPEAIVVGGFTDFVDTVRTVVGGDHPATVIEDDCTAVIVPDSRSDEADDGRHGYYGQTWDMHDTATEFVVLLRITPTDGPAALVFTTTGCVGQIGMNELGVCVGINNLVCTDGTRGVTWPTVVRAMLERESADDALNVLLAADIAGAHNYLIFDSNGVGYNVEAMPTARVVTKLDDEPLIHTNHVLHDEARAVEGKRDHALLASSAARLARAGELLADGPIDAERLFDLTRDPEAICQVPFDPYRIESSGAAVMRPATGDFWACWGPPSDNDYQHFTMPTTDR